MSTRSRNPNSLCEVRSICTVGHGTIQWLWRLSPGDHWLRSGDKVVPEEAGKWSDGFSESCALIHRLLPGKNHDLTLPAPGQSWSSGQIWMGGSGPELPLCPHNREGIRA